MLSTEVKKRYHFISEEHGPHMKIIRYIGRGRRVLDVGCATGYLAEKLTKNDCEVYGIEVDPSATQEAEKHCKEVLLADIEDIEELPWPEKFFDVFIYADILEHLKRPDLALLKFRRYLKPDGILIVSLPNIAYWRMRLNMLLGRFNYEEVGIIDKTHLRFFTIETGQYLVEECGFKVVKLDYCGWAMKYFPLKLFRAWFAFQFVIYAKHG